jgi:hypothetical protein
MGKITDTSLKIYLKQQPKLFHILYRYQTTTYASVSLNKNLTIRRRSDATSASGHDAKGVRRKRRPSEACCDSNRIAVRDKNCLITPCDKDAQTRWSGRDKAVRLKRRVQIRAAKSLERERIS